MAEPEQPRPAPSAAGRIKPAGWIVIALFLSGIGYGAWRVVQAFSGPSTTVTTTTTTEPPKPVAITNDSVLAKVTIREARALPEVRGTVARTIVPPLNAIEIGDSGARVAASESAALDALLKGEAEATIVSVGALAAHPEAIRSNVRATWLVGYAPLDAGLFPSCDPQALRSATLSAVAGSLGHLHLLAALGGGALPHIELAPSEADLDRAIAESKVNGGATRLARDGKSAPVTPCRVLPRAAFALVVARLSDRPMSDAELASIVALSKSPAIDPEDVDAFFDPARTAPGGFFEVFDAASRIWLAAGVIQKTVSARDAVDRTFLEPVRAAPTAPATTTASTSRFGYPSWIDGHK